MQKYRLLHKNTTDKVNLALALVPGLLASYKAIPKIGAVEIVKDSKIFIFVDSFGNLCNIHITIDAKEDKTKIPIQSFQLKGAVNVVQEY